jgi:CRP-like cAMP-binding protein
MSIEVVKAFFEQNDLFEKTIVVNRNEFITKAGSADTNIYFVEQGSLKVFIQSDTAEEQIVRFAYDNNIVVALDAYFKNGKTDYYIQAIKKSVVKVASKHKFEQVLMQHQGFLILWNEMLQDLLLQQLEREKDLLTQSPQNRYLRVLKRSPHLFQLIPHKYIANYLGMTPETLSRIKKS